MTRQLPILFRPDLVRKILDGEKTQTRRPVKPQPEWEEEPGPCNGAPGRWAGRYRDLGRDGEVVVDVCERRCPFGEPGTLLYVHYRADDSTRRFLTPDADAWSRRDWQRKHRHAQWNARWRPSIHMPKWASRLWLRVTGVRVDRVQEITEADAKAEGVGVAQRASEMGSEPHRGSCVHCGQPRAAHIGTAHVCPHGTGTVFSRHTYRGGFSWLWESAYPGSWERNDWVWVVSFEKTETPR